MKTVTVYVPIQLKVKGKDVYNEVIEQLHVIEDIVAPSELESEPIIMFDLIGDSDIVEE